MNCLEVQESLAAYFDGEIAADVRSVMETHLGQCSACTRDLAGFKQLSVMTHALQTPPPPDSLWAQIEQQLDQRPLAVSVERPRTWASLAPRLFALAATVIVAVGLGSFIHDSWIAQGEHDQLVVEFGQYVDGFRRDPIAAQQIFLAKYENQLVDPQQAIQHVGYHPAVARGLPEGYTLVSTHVVTMPCCTCVQAICKRSDGSTLAIFEHDENQTIDWFGDSPETMTACHNKQCCFVQLDGQLAASWRQGTRHITMLGVENVAEVSQMVAWMDESKAP